MAHFGSVLLSSQYKDFLRNCVSLCVSKNKIFHLEAGLTYTKFQSSARNHTDQRKQAPPPDVRCDMIGPSDPVSNLRPMKFHVPENESLAETALRQKRLDVQQWNQEFWIKHNSSFVKERKEFISANQLDKDIVLTAEEMSVFYKSFLDKNWRSHLTYNWEWYKRNALLVLLHLRVNLERLSRRRVKLAGKRVQ